MSTASLKIEKTSNGNIKIGNNEYSKTPSENYVAILLITDENEIKNLTESKTLVSLPDGKFGKVVPNTDVITLEKLEKVSYKIDNDEKTINEEHKIVDDELSVSVGGKYAPFFLKSFKSSKKNKKTKCRKGPRKLNTRRRK
jgi:hypothetical protein